MKTFIKLIVLFLLFQTTTSYSQLIGGRDNGQQAPGEVKASALSAGGVSGDVSLFNGTFGTSYNLGTVSTPGGLSYSATLSSSSSLASGDNLIQTAGIPYGYGWNVDIPMISISSEDYNHYNPSELNQFTGGSSSSPEPIPFPYLYKEGELYWYAPTLNIPGVASGRMVYKYTDSYRGSERAVFVLHKFERYIEARFDGSKWEVLLDDGTTYHFGIRQAKQRNANNRRHNRNERVGAKVSEEQIVPKVETLAWYINKISHPNKWGDISFLYDTYGEFDLFQEFKQRSLAQAIQVYTCATNSEPTLTRSVYSDIFLRSIDAGTDRLEFDYQSESTSGTFDLYALNGNPEQRFDSLYTKEVVAAWGDMESFNDWIRYKHLKADGPYNEATNSIYSISPNNPYIGKNVSVGLGCEDNFLYAEQIAASTNVAPLDHGFLESPLFGEDLSSGDMYEIRIEVSNPLKANCNFDINIVAGDNSVNFPQTYYQGNPEHPYAGRWNAKRSETVFTTFNQAIKWNSLADRTLVDPTSFTMSNFFSMPALLPEYEGIRIQVGPANADLDYDLRGDHPSGYAMVDNVGGTYYPNTCLAYLYEHPLCQAGCLPSSGRLLDGHNVSPNFGVGLPWHMVLPIYTDIDQTQDYCSLFNPVNNGLNFWWENEPDDPSLTLTPFDNVPTLADENVKITKVELIRHARNPYMLNQVRHLKLNGVHNSSGTGFEDGWQLMSKKGFQYDEMQLPGYDVYENFVNVDTIPGSGIPGTVDMIAVQYAPQYEQNIDKTRNVFLLDKIEELPIRDPGQYLDHPTTHFAYDTMSYFYQSDQAHTLYSNFPTHSSHVLLTGITDPLGKQTQIVYNEEPVVGASFIYIKRPTSTPQYDCSSPIKSGYPFTSTVHYQVESKILTDADGIRQWDYEYFDRKFIQDYTPIPPNMSWDIKLKTKYGHSQTLVTSPELVSGNRPYTKYYHYNIGEDINVELGKPATISENDGLLWGKLYKTEQYDGADNLLNKTEISYEFQKAFVRGKLRTRHNKNLMTDNGNYPLGHDYIDRIIPDYASPNPTIDSIYPTVIPTSPNVLFPWEVSALTDYYYNENRLNPEPLTAPLPVDSTLVKDWITYYRDVLIPYYNDGINNGYGFHDIQRPPHITEWIYSLYPFPEYYASAPDTVSEYYAALERYEMYQNYFFQAYELWNENYYLFSPTYTAEYPSIRGLSCFSGMKPYESVFENHILAYQASYYLDSYFIKTAQSTETAYDNSCSGSVDSLQTITEYEYYDADETGSTTSEGYDILLHGNTNWQQLQWEPSWQLYKKKSYSPQHPDAYTATEYFYYYDMMNQEHIPVSMNKGLGDYLQNLDDGNDKLFYPVHWSWKYKMRNIAFQERVTSKAPGQDAISQSTYLTYSNEWNDISVFSNEQLEDIILNECDATGNGGMTSVGGYDNCLIVNSGDCYNPPDAMTTVIGEDNSCYWCLIATSEDVDSLTNGGENDSRQLIDLGYAHKDNLFYQTTEIQTNEVIKSTYQSVPDAKYAILRFTEDAANTNNFLPDFPYSSLKTHKVIERNMYGAVQLEEDEKRLKTRYEYTGVKSQRYWYCDSIYDTSIGVMIMDLVNVPTSITVGVGLPDSLTTHYTYHENYSIDSIIDPNGKLLTYGYDYYGRLRFTYLNGQKTGEIAYHQWNSDHSKDFETRMLDNYVETRTYNEIGENESMIARAYVDPLGRSAITATHKASTSSELIVAGGIDYDNWDRQTKLYKPYLYNSGFNSLSYNMHQALSPNYAENQYEDTPRSRVFKSAKYGIDINTSSHTVDNAYCLISGDVAATELDLNTDEQNLLFSGTPSAYRLMRTQMTDEDGKTAIEYTNAVGQKIATMGNDGTDNIITLFVYDSRGQLVEVINPKKQESAYVYNLLGQLCEKTTVDGGTTNYVYNTSGQVIIEEDAKSAAEGAARFYEYDKFGRPTEQVYYSTSALQQTGIIDSLDAAQETAWMFSGGASGSGSMSGFILEKRFFYGNDFDANEASISPIAQNKLGNLDNEKGQVSHTISYDLQGNPIEYRFMSYNENGWLDWEIVQFNAEGLSLTSQGSTTIIDLPDYNLQGSLKTQNIDLNGDGLDFQHHYTYDDFNRLNEVYISYTDDKQQGYKVASYTYNDALGLVDEVKYYASGDNGTLKNQEIETITHSYDIRDRLTELDAGLFNWRMFYDNDNPTQAQNTTTSWNGNINSTQATYKLAGTTNATALNTFENESTYAYTYDGLNRLRAAACRGYLGSVGSTAYTYDNIGNLNILNRITEQGIVPYNYVYEVGTNRLQSVENGPTRYTYDPNGNMLTDTKKNLTNTVYGRANLPQQLSVGTDTIIHYLYDVNDMRIYKKLDSAAVTVFKEEYYLRDATGRELAIIDDTGNIVWYIYGKERIASTNEAPLVYELDVKVWLEGAYSEQNGLMTTGLNERGLLPGQTPFNELVSSTPIGQPYNVSPWFYQGNEGDDYDENSYATTVVDWVLLSLRTEIDTTAEIFKTAALLHSDGQLELAEGIFLPRSLATDSVYVVIEHRNHTGIISAQKIGLTDNILRHDFTASNSAATGATGQKEIAPSVWAMLAGNAITLPGSQSDDINGQDKSEWAVNNGSFDRYLSSDFNLNGDVSGQDKVLWAENNGTFCELKISRAYVAQPVNAPVPQLNYYLYDHLGNTRVTYSVEVLGVNNISYTTESAMDYFPYGKALRSFGKERYLSTHHERDTETDFDYRGARFYDADVARFNSLDPLAMDLAAWSPYNYVLANPNAYTDPDGKWPTPDTVWDVGNVVYGVGSLIKNVAAGNYVGAFVDGVGVVIDVVATAVPVVPGGAATGLKAIREGSELAVKNSDEVIEFSAEAAGQAAKDMTDEAGGVLYNNGYRSADGKFASPKGDAPAAGANAEKSVWNAVEAKDGWSVTEGRVYVKDAGGNVRVYDGAAHSPNGNNIGLEVKSGGASRTTSQKNFDTNLNSSSKNTVQGTGKNKDLTIHRALEIRHQ